VGKQGLSDIGMEDRSTVRGPLVCGVLIELVVEGQADGMAISSQSLIWLHWLWNTGLRCGPRTVILPGCGPRRGAFAALKAAWSAAADLRTAWKNATDAAPAFRAGGALRSQVSSTCTVAASRPTWPPGPHPCQRRTGGSDPALR
jgi:hypothetical protein